jgi:hypothetical protein
MSYPMFDRSTAPPYQQAFDYTGSPDGSQPVYIGWAPTGALTSDAKWSIRKLSYDGSNRVTNIQYASGDTGFKKIWDNRASYTYL